MQIAVDARSVPRWKFLLTVLALLAGVVGLDVVAPAPAAASSGQLYGPIPHKFWGSVAPRVGADGNVVVYASWLRNFDEGAPFAQFGVFINDRSASGADEAAVVPVSGPRPNATSWPLAVSSDASSTYVLYRSSASNLVAGDTLGFDDVFLYNRLTNVTERVSVGDGEQQANGASAMGAISANGRFVAFSSQATNLVAPASNGNTQVFVRDRQLGTTRQVSFGAGGAQANGDALGVSISDDGRYVAFASAGSNLVAGDTNNSADVFVRDVQLGTTELVSQGFAGPVTGWSSVPSISADGRFVAFESDGDDVVPGDENVASDVFVRDRAFGTTERVSVGPNGEEGFWDSANPSMSKDGRFIAFESDAEEFDPEDGNISIDVFVRDRLGRTTERASERQNGMEAFGDSWNPSISPEGRYVAFDSDSEEFSCSGCDTNADYDVFLKQLPNNFVNNTNLGSRYQSVTPKRVLDTTSSAKLSAGGTVDVQVTGGATTVPAAATSVMLNVLSTGGTVNGGVITAYPTGVARPPTAALHTRVGVDVSNQVAVKVGNGGKVRLYSGGATHLTVDVVGYFTADGGDAFTPTVASAVVDTRGAGVPEGWPAGQPLVSSGAFARLDVPVAGVGDVPTDARAVAVTISILGSSTTNARASAFATGTPNPGVTNAVTAAGGLVSTTAVVPVGAGGRISLTLDKGFAHVMVTVNGYFGPFAKDLYFPLAPARAFDTRTTSGSEAIAGHTGPLQSAESTSIALTGRAGIPANAKAVMATTSAIGTPGIGIVVTAPFEGPLALRADLIYGATLTMTNTNVLGLGSNGSVLYLNFSQWFTHLFSDAYGYFR
jgi:Tol biopolymer transport system component